MDLFEGLLTVFVVAEILFMIQVIKNFRYATKRHVPSASYCPSCLVVVPCKGLDESFEKNIRSFYELAYTKYRLWFVVEDTSDPAYAALEQIKQQQAHQSHALDVQILVAGYTAGSSQKLHNLLHACRQAPTEVEVLIFADSDACAKPDWLVHLIRLLEQPRVGLTSGYRWFVPLRNNPATLALSAMNAKICQLLGTTRFNLAWGGSMAIRKNDFNRLGIAELWSCSLSDDISISQAVSRAGLQTRFVPGCVVASYLTMTWSRLWEFARRQFIITRIYAPKIWLFGLAGSLLSVAAFWGGLSLTVWAAAARPVHCQFYFIVGAVLLGCQMIRALLRQMTGFFLLPNDRAALRPARWADWLGYWVWAVLMLAVIIGSAFGRTIVWRGIKYRIHKRCDVEIIKDA